MDQNSRKTHSDKKNLSPQENNQTVDYSLFYSRKAQPNESHQSSFAPPVRLSSQNDQNQTAQPISAVPSDISVNGMNIYHRTLSSEAETKNSNEYRPMIEEPQKAAPSPFKKFRYLPVFLLVLVVAVSLFFLLRKPENQEEAIELASTATENVILQTTPEINAYRPAPKINMNSAAQAAIMDIAPNISFESTVLSNHNILAATPCFQQHCDYYLFSSDKGRLIAYFEEIPQGGAFFQENGNLYVCQAPFVMTPEGKPVIRFNHLTELFGENAILHPFYNEWAAVENPETKEWNFLNSSGSRYNNMEYVKVFPFSGQYTVAYLDTGNVGNERFLLFILDKDGIVTRWKSTDTIEEIVVSLNNVAVTRQGEIYQLFDFSSPFLTSSDIIFYPDFDAMVILDDQTSKYSLYIQGKLYYECEYSSIRPMPSDLPWKTVQWKENNCQITLCALDPCMVNPPSACSFALTSDTGTEYVSLSLISHYPLLYKDEVSDFTEVLP